MASLAVAGTVLSVLNGVFNVALDISRLQDVDKDLRICLDFLVVVNSDLNRARELRTDKFAGVNSEAASGDRSYIDGVIERMEKGTLEMGQLIVAYHIRCTKYVILSGGLGSSPYLLKRIRSKLSNDIGLTALNIEVLLSDESQLSVCRGLVLDRLQKVTQNRHVLTGRVWPKSYGVVCGRKYDKQNPDHISGPFYKNEITGETMVARKIQWLIKKGQLIDPDVPIFYPFFRHIDESSSFSSLHWKETITISDSERPPGRLDHADCRVLSKVTSSFTPIDIDNLHLKTKWRPWYKISKGKVRVANFQLGVVIYPSDIQFQLWLNGQQYMDPSSTRVEWQKGSTTAPLPEEKPIDSSNGSLAASSEHKKKWR